MKKCKAFTLFFTICYFFDYRFGRVLNSIRNTRYTYQMKNTVNQKTINIVLLIMIAGIAIAFLFMQLNMNRRMDELGTAVVRLIQAQNGESAPPRQSPETAPEVEIDGLKDYSYLGSQTAPIDMVLVLDFQCSFCIREYKELFPQIREDLVASGEVKISYLPFPLDNIHENAIEAALAASAAEEQDMFWDFFDFLFQNIEDLNRDIILEHAQQSGADLEQFSNHMDNEANLRRIKDIQKSLSEQGVSGTPAIILNDRLFVGFKPYNQLQQIFAAM